MQTWASAKSIKRANLGVLAAFLLSISFPVGLNPVSGGVSSVNKVSAAGFFYASPTGTATNLGTDSSPWDLRTALKNTNVNAGSTLYLKGGIYKGSFTSTISGAPGNPVIVKPAPGENPVIDGNDSFILGTALAAGATTCEFPNATRTFDAGPSVMVDDEALYLINQISTNKYSCLRGWDGTGNVTHPGTSTVRVKGPGLQVNGANVWFIGLEITNSFTERYFPTFSGNTDTPKKAGGIYVSAPGVKLINNRIHDVSHPGISMFDQAAGCSDTGSADGKNQCTEAYGNIVWGNGFYDASRGNQPNGAGIYAHNTTGNKYIRDNIFFRNLSQGIDVYTRESRVSGFKVEGNTVFDNGYWDVWFGNDEYGSQANISDNVIFRRLNANREALILGSGQPLVNPNIVNNYIVGGSGSNSPFAFSLNRLVGGNITGNTIVSPGTINIIGTCTGGGQQSDLTCNNPFSLSGNYTNSAGQTTNYPLNWNNNKYFGTAPKSFARPQQLLNYPEWRNFYKTEPSDTQNKNFTAGYPSENKVSVRRNVYTEGRGNITIVNWNNAQTVPVNLAGVINSGESYVIKDAQNIDRYESNGNGGLVFKPGTIVASGVYNGTTVNVPMNQTSVAKLSGLIEAVNNLPGDGKPTAPLFGSYIVEKLSSSNPQEPITPPSPPTTINIPPSGHLDGIKNDINDTAYGNLFGWVKDDNEPNKAVTVHLYVDKTACAGCSPDLVFQAGEYRSDVGAHGFNVMIPQQFRDYKSHTYRLYAIDTQGGDNPLLPGSPSNFTWTKPASVNPGPTPTPPAPTPLSYWSSTFWNNMTMTGNAATARTDNTIDFTWATNAPATGVNKDKFSARFQKEENFTAGTYTFNLTADDGVRLYVDNQLKIDQWRDTGTTTYNQDVDITEGSHTIRIDYYENTGDAVLKFTYSKKPGSSPSNPVTTTSWSTSFWNNKNLSGNTAATRTDTEVNFDWGSNSPNQYVNANAFSSRFERAFDLDTGTYKFTVTGDDGVRLFVDNELKIDQWRDTSVQTYTTELNLSAGRHVVRLEQYDNGGMAVVKVSFVKTSVVTPAPTPVPTPTPPPAGEPSGNAWLTSFWNNKTLSGTPSLTRTDADLNFDWASSSPATEVIADGFSSRFERVISFENATYTLSVTGDDGIRLYVDNQLKIDKWVDTSVKTYTVDVPMTAGDHTIKVEQYDNTGLAVAKYSAVKITPPTPVPAPVPVPPPAPVPTPAPQPTPTPTPTPSPVAAPLVLVGPTTTSITAGQSANITITPYNSVSLTVSPAIPGCVLSSTAATTCTVQPSTTTTYTFTGTNSTGVTMSNSSTVNVTPVQGGASGGGTTTTAPEITVNVSQPTAGNYKLNSNITIAWNVTGDWQSKGWPNFNGNPYVSLDLYKNGVFYMSISQSINFVNTITIPVSYALGENYQFRVAAIGDPTKFGLSQAFNIVQ